MLRPVSQYQRRAMESMLCHILRLAPLVHWFASETDALVTSGQLRISDLWWKACWRIMGAANSFMLSTRQLHFRWIKQKNINSRQRQSQTHRHVYQISQPRIAALRAQYGPSCCKVLFKDSFQSGVFSIFYAIGRHPLYLWNPSVPCTKHGRAKVMWAQEGYVLHQLATFI